MFKENLFYINNHNKHKVKPKTLIEDLSRYHLPPERQYILTKDDIYRCIRVLLCFGRIIGIVPISGLFSGNLISVSFRWN